MNKKGFTLIELLGVIIILSIIMLIAIPNITSILDRSKKDTYITDAKKMVSLVQYEIRKGNYQKPINNHRTDKITLRDLSTSEIEKDSDGNIYDLDNSYVIIARTNNKLYSFVQLLSKNSNNENYTGIKFVYSEDLEKDNRYEKYSKNNNPATNAEIDAIIGNTN